MAKTNCVILDDEARNVELLEKMLVLHCPQLTLVGKDTDAKKGIRMIRELNPHLVFLDIEMPQLNGFEALKQLEPVNFEVIFVTAYGKYALQAFEHQVAGYVTKPINTEKLVAAVQMALQRLEQKAITKNLFSLLEQSGKSATPDKIPLSTTNGLVFVKIGDIVYCESSGNYTHFYLRDHKRIVVSRQLGEYEKLLPENNFIRIHDKYIINLHYIREYIKGSGGEVVLEDGKELPVATRRKEDFLARFEKWIRRRS
ncbi:MAG TPA: LytTR family DNA-binding domain-containing protein [Chitinophagaceae bacterium]|nr:LytTR family DNA-binding domain-containing protein [Chitinophagaceae bacterium]